MRIDEIRIGAYRSLYDVTFRPSSFTVLVGPNNSGKTNFMEALHFLAEVYQYDLETAINRKGGFENVAHRRVRRTKRPVSFVSQVELSVGEALARGRPRRRKSSRSTRDPTLVVRHAFAFRAAGQAIEAAFSVVGETLTISSKDKNVVRELFSVTRHDPDSMEFHRADLESWPSALRRDADYILDPFPDDVFREYLSRQHDTTRLLISDMRFNDVVNVFLRGFAGTRLHQITPLEARRPGVPTPNPALERHGSNLPALVAYVRRHVPRAWNQMLDAMQRVVPHLEDIRTDFTPDRLLTLQFVERGVGRPWTVDEVSDGTMQTLALFGAIFDPRTPLLLIEEPENSVHPWIIRTFVEACRAAEGKQAIVSTHSPVLVDALSPEELCIVWREEGRTDVRPLPEIEPDARSMWERGDVGIFDLLDSGLLSQSVPGRLL